MDRADPRASTGVFTLDYEALGLTRYHRHEAEDAADGGSGAVNPSAPEAWTDPPAVMAATQARFREGNKDAAYAPGPDAVEQAGAPPGRLISFKDWKSNIYPGTSRDWHIYIPAACVPTSRSASLSQQFSCALLSFASDLCTDSTAGQCYIYIYVLGGAGTAPPSQRR